MTPTTGAPVLAFADAALRLGAAARGLGLVVPAFRVPPRVPGVTRTLRKHEGGSVVSVVLKDRPMADVVADMVCGVCEVNDRGDDAELHAELLAAAAT